MAAVRGCVDTILKSLYKSQKVSLIALGRLRGKPLEGIQLNSLIIQLKDTDEYDALSYPICNTRRRIQSERTSVEVVFRSCSSNSRAPLCNFLRAYWSLMIRSTVPLSVLADPAIPTFSSLFNGIWIVAIIPFLPRTTGMLRQQPNSGWKWLTGRTFRLSRRIEEQMLDTMEPIPKGIAPLA
jgi:hypothetical protein